MKLILILSFLCYVQIYAQESMVGYFEKTTFEFLDAECTDAGSIVYDDGTFENGYGWVSTITDGRFVSLFTPSAYPWQFYTFCLALTRIATSPTSFTFNIVMYDNTGPGGTPGNEIGVVSGVTANNIPIYPTLQFYDFDISSMLPVASGSVFIGIKYDPSLFSSPIYSGADESTTTPLHLGYAWSGSAWSTIQSIFTSYRCMSYRTLGLSGPIAPTLVSPSNGATEIPVNPTLTWNASSGANTYGLQISLNSSFVFPSFNFDGLAVTSFTIPIDLPANTIFYWRVNASNSNGTSAYSSTRNFTTVAQVNLTQTISFPNKTNPKDYTTTDYKIVGLPGQPNLNVASLLSGTQGTDWESYWDNGGASNYYEKYNSSSPFSFTKGQSYWIVQKGNLAVNQTVPGARVNGSGYTDIPLSGGFNLITNPYIVQVLWSGILAANALPAGTPLNSFSTSGWGTSANMQAYAGYVFDNANDLSTLRIPYPIVPSPLQKSANLDLWRVNVHLECNEFIDENTSFGVSFEANQDRDKYDFRKPRSPGSIPMVYFYHPDWDDGYGLFAADMRPEFEGIQEWDLNVDSKLRETIKLTFDGLEDVPDDMEIYLMDIDRSYSINLRESTEYSFIPVKDHSQLKVVVGESEKVNLVLNNLIPTEFILGNNFPNPFNPATTIQVSVPNTSDIKLIVYNILGQEIRVLFEGISAPGNHWFEWNGKDQQGLSVPSGVYIYTLRTSTGFNISKKMVVMK